MASRNEQEAFWANEFGDEYLLRNQSQNLEASNTAAWSQMLKRTYDIQSILELGANVGMNMRAIRHVMPTVSLNAVEINKTAYGKLSNLPGITAHNSSIAEFKTDQTYDLVFTKGVLIHIQPEQLPAIYKKMIALSKKWILICEYYNPTPVEVPYRGHANKLFKRDFCGELLDSEPSLRLVDYGFFYSRDSIAAQDDCNWFLVEKK